MIEIEPVDRDSWRVTVAGPEPTTHTVTLRDADRERLAGADGDAEALIRRSFEFLLEREPASSILPTFDLTLIGRYFPEYEAEMARGR